MKTTKTDRFINLILEISKAPDFELTQDMLKTYLGNPSKSQFHAYVSELTSSYAERPAILTKIKNNTDISYKLNNQTFESYFCARDEGDFLLEVYKKLGYIIDAGIPALDFSESTNKNHFSRKFFYLSKVQGNTFNKDQKNILHKVIKSLLANKVVEFKYGEKNDDYTVYPLSLCQYRDEIYLLGDKDELGKNQRTFKVARISELKLTKEEFSYPARSKWDPDALFKNSSGLIRGEESIAVIRVFGHAKNLISEKSFFNATLINEETEYCEYECKYTGENEFLGQLFVYADEIEVVSPHSLKEQLIEKARACLKNNEGLDDAG